MIEFLSNLGNLFGQFNFYISYYTASKYILYY